MVSKRNLKLSELVARAIVRDIAERGLRPGDVLKSEAEMLEDHGVGRASLREALRLLEVQGLVQIKPGPHGGPVVGTVDPAYLGRTISLFLRMAGSTYGDLCEHSLMLTPPMAELAAQRASREEAERLFAPFFDKLNADNQDMGGTLRAAKREKEFHPLVNRLAGNPVMALMLDAIGALIAEHMLSNIGTINFIEQAHTEHGAIAQAIIDKNPRLARDLMYEHTKHLTEFYRDNVPGMFDQPVEWR